MSSALIGSSGFVGSTLLKQRSFDFLYRSTNINDIDRKSFDFVACAGASASKWAANANPNSDLQKINELIAHLKTIQCNIFVLFSTVDVFKIPINVDESTPVEETGLHPYGLHRRVIEKFVQTQFPNHLIVRLPGLVGPGLRKNVIFDLLNENNLHTVDSRGEFQFYPMINLWQDIVTALNAGLKLLHLTAKPMSVFDIAKYGFGKPFHNITENPPSIYNFKSKYAEIFGGNGYYQYSERETLLAVRAYAQTEPKAGNNNDPKVSP